MNATCAAQLLPEWKQQDSLLAKASVGFGQPRVSNLSQQSDSALPQSASLRLVQAPAAFNRPIVQRKLFKPPFVVSTLPCSSQLSCFAFSAATLASTAHCHLFVSLYQFKLYLQQASIPTTWRRTAPFLLLPLPTQMHIQCITHCRAIPLLDPLLSAPLCSTAR